MLRAGEEIDTDVRRWRDVLRPIRRRVHERREAIVAPIFDSRVRIEHPRLIGARPVVVEQALDAARKRVAQCRIREWKSWGRRLALIGTGATLVDAQPGAARNVRHDAIEHLTPALIGIEAVVQERPQKAARLRGAERIGVLHRRQRARDVLEPRRRVAERRQAGAGDRQVDGARRDFVHPPGHETALQCHLDARAASSCCAAGRRHARTTHRARSARRRGRSRRACIPPDR